LHRKASAKNSSKLNKFLHSEVNLLIQPIIVQDQDGQNNGKDSVTDHNVCIALPLRGKFRPVPSNELG